MKYDLLRKKEPFPKTIAKACLVVSNWKNQSQGRINIIGESISG